MRMRKAARVSLFGAAAGAALFACGNNKSNNKTPDAKPIDAAIDAKVFMDAAIDAPPMYDFSCFGKTPGTTATDPVTIAGTTQTLTMNGPQAVAAVAVDSFKASNPNVSIDTQTSDANGLFTTGNLDPGNTGMAVDGFLRAQKATLRSTFLYPPFPLTASLTSVPVLMLSDTTFTLIAQTGFQVTQDDTQNGAFFLVVTDCSRTPIVGATLTVQQAGANVGTIEDLGALAAQAKGTFLVFNVPDGATQVAASFMGMTFPTHTILAHKKPNGAQAEGTLTVTQIPPGP